MTHIFVSSGITPVHSFDLWGTLVIQDVLGPRVLEAYNQLMNGKESPEIIAQNIANYDGVLKGDKKALENKKVHVDTIEDPLWTAYLRGEIDVNFDGALYQDALTVMDDIAKAGEGLCILTTGNSPWVHKAVASLNPIVGDVLGKVYSGNKAKPEAYEVAANDLSRNMTQMVSHTEDQMKGLAGILQSELRHQVVLVYVERANLAVADDVLAQGIDHYVTDLTRLLYTTLVKK
ncbi:HAD family hydrolase [Candidatus Woesearchaeota archaeon]|nr:HAD family hydrolase [Candidatus Woesearchaeota archaeon]